MCSGIKITNLILFVLSLSLSYGEVRVFESNRGETFVGQIIEVNENNVTILKSSDNKTYTTPWNRFSLEDRNYFSKILSSKETALGSDVTSIRIRCKSLKINKSADVRYTGRTLVDVDSYISDSYIYGDYLYVETTTRTTTRPETIVTPLRTAKVLVEASSTSGPVNVRLFFAYYYRGLTGPTIHKVIKRDVIVDRGEGSAIFETEGFKDYYGYGVLAVNMATGIVIGYHSPSRGIMNHLKSYIPRG